MAKKTDTTRRNAVASAISDAMTTSQTLGATLVTQCVTVCNKFFRGKPIGKEEREAILDKLAEMRGWSDKAAKVRKSEARNLLEHYSSLNELVKKFRTHEKNQNGSCTWHNVVQLAREVGKHSGKTRINAAVNALLDRTTASTVPPNKLTRGEAKRKVAMGVKSMLKMTRLEPEFRTKLAALCAEFNINV